MNKNAAHKSARMFARRAFTLTELLVVLVIVAVLAAIIVPGVRTLTASQEVIASEARLTASIQTARSLAAANPKGADVAAVFMQELTYDRGGNVIDSRTRIIMCSKVASYVDPIGSTGTRNLPRPEAFDIFVPIEGIEPSTLPQGYTVAGLTPASTVTPGGPGAVERGTGWYGDGPFAVTPFPPANDAQSVWVLPQTAFFDHSAVNVDEGQDRQTFMVRFEAGSGVLTSGGVPALVLMPEPGIDPELRRQRLAALPNGVNLAQGTGQISEIFRADLVSDYRRFVTQVLADPRLNGRLEDPMEVRRALIGPQASDMVQTRALSTVALIDIEDMAGSMQATIDPLSQSVWRMTREQSRTTRAYQPQFVDGFTPDRLRRYVRGLDPRQTNNLPATVAPSVRVFTVERYGGSLQAAAIRNRN
jgi:prepilin-type N-terminal cleavage/methylation domain-containing protein